MNTREDLENELRSQLEVSSNSTKFPSARITKLIQNAYTWITGAFNWKELATAMTTNTIANHDYYDQPSNCKSGSIFMLEIDGIPYDRKNYEDFIAFRRNNPTSTKKIFSHYGKQLFVSPTPTSNGSDNMSVWFIQEAAQLDNASDETVFSQHRSELNEAIISKALSVATKKTDKALSTSELNSAVATAARINKAEWSEYQRDQRIQHPQFTIPDFFGNYYAVPGNFGYDPTSEFYS